MKRSLNCRIVENTVESMSILSSLQLLNDTTMIMEMSFLDTRELPNTIRIVSVTRPFAKNPMILVRFVNVFDPNLDSREDDMETFSICNMFAGFSVIVHLIYECKL